MKIKPSYQHQFFAPVLAISFLAHAAVFATSYGFLSFSPRFGVKQAPSSMEVVISKVEEPERKPLLFSRVLTTADSPQSVAVKKEEKPRPEKKQKPVYIPPQKGAAERPQNDYLKNPAPIYPELAREMGWEGVTLLRVFVQSNGNPEEIEVENSSGHKILDDAAVKAVKKWKFKPAGIGNVSFSTWVKIPVRFTLVDK